MKKTTIEKASVLLFFFLGFFIYTNAQEVAIKGKLIDSASAKAIPVATINFQELERKISKTVVSDVNGTFQAVFITRKIPGYGYA